MVALDLFGALFCELQRNRFERFIGRVDFRKQVLDLRIVVELACLLLKDQVISHAAGSEVPDAFLILAAVRMRVKMSWAFVSFLFKQLDEEEEILDSLRAEPQVLIEARPFLIIEIDME